MKKWELEKINIKFIPLPLNFIKNKYYNDEVIIEEIRKTEVTEKQKKEIKIQEIKEDIKTKENIKIKENIRKTWNNLTEKQQKEIEEKAREYAEKQNPKLKNTRFIIPLIKAKQNNILKKLI